MNKRISVIVLLAVVVVLGVALSQGSTPSTSPATGNSSSSEKTILTVFSPGEEPNLKELHDTVLARLKSETPLTGEEKSALAVIFETVNGASIQGEGSDVQFSSAEAEKILRLLSE